jgi:hypothetical protein
MIKTSSKIFFRFIGKLLLILFIIYIFDFGIGKVLKVFYLRLEDGLYGQITYCIESTSADVLILGSSRANHSYVPEVFEEGPYTCYNAGRDGSFVLYNYALFKAVITRYTPKKIIIDISPDELSYSAAEYERLSLLLPYYQSHPEIRDIIDLRGPLERVKHISSVYFYNSLVFQVVRGTLPNGKVKVQDMKGYQPLQKKMKYDKIDTVKIDPGNTDENKISALKDIISTCHKKNIDLVFVYSPIWKITKDGYCNQIITKLCTENGIKYIDMSNLPDFINRPDYFADISHLNEEGARVFSKMLKNRLKQVN